MNGRSQCQRVLDVLADGQPHTIQEIHERAGTMRLNSRVAELRSRGHTITCTRHGDTYSYRLDSLGKEGPPVLGEKTERGARVERCTLSDGPSSPSEPPVATPPAYPPVRGGVKPPAGGQLELFKAAA